LCPTNNYSNYDISGDDEDVHPEIYCHGELDSNEDNEGTDENLILDINNLYSNGDRHKLKANDWLGTQVKHHKIHVMILGIKIMIMLSIDNRMCRFLFTWEFILFSQQLPISIFGPL